MEPARGPPAGPRGPCHVLWCRKRDPAVADIEHLINALAPKGLAVLQERGPDQRLDRGMLDAIDRAAGGPGEGRGYYLVRGSLEPAERRYYTLRDGVAAAIFAPATIEGAAG